MDQASALWSWIRSACNPQTQLPGMRIHTVMMLFYLHVLSSAGVNAACMPCQVKRDSFEHYYSMEKAKNEVAWTPTVAGGAAGCGPGDRGVAPSRHHHPPGTRPHLAALALPGHALKEARRDRVEGRGRVW